MANQSPRSDSSSGSPPPPQAPGPKPHLHLKCPFPLRYPSMYENQNVACNSAEFPDLSDWRDHMKRVHRDDYNCPSCRQRHQQRDEALKDFMDKHANCMLMPSLGFRPEIMTKEQSDADRKHSLRGRNNLSTEDKIRSTLKMLFPGEDIPLDKLWPGAPQIMPNLDILEAFGGFQAAGKYKNPDQRDSGYGSIGGDKEPDASEVEPSTSPPTNNGTDLAMMGCGDLFDTDEPLPALDDWVFEIPMNDLVGQGDPSWR